MSETHSIQVMIPTLNEASHIAAAVANARLLGEVFVLDSCSTDGTQDLARQAGATVVEHAFVDYASQKNWGLDHLPFTAEWVFILDADERLTQSLCDEIRRRISQTPRMDGFYVNRLMLFMGRAIRHGGMYPAWNLRLFRRGHARYEQRSVHEHMVCIGPTDYLKRPMLHIRRESITRYISKHIHYAELESDEWIKDRFDRSSAARASRLFKDVLRIRQDLRRRVWPRLPMRPLLRFLYMYVFRVGFLDGMAGWRLARLMSQYEYMIGLLYAEKADALRKGAGKG